MISSARTRRHRPAVPLRRLLLASAAALLPVLAGCEAGNQAPTLEFRVPTDAQTASAGNYLKQQLQDKLIEHKQYIDRHGQDMPEIRNWRWQAVNSAGAAG